MRELLSRIGNPERALKVVHVTGTNGKGSVCAFLTRILQEAGYKVGLYTSPHIIRFNERIQIDGREISDPRIVELYDTVRPHISEMAASFRSKQLTFFEVTTAMAFQYFIQEEIDVAVVEVGMGGRMDATNVLDPEVSVLTRIGLEHTEYLGKTLDRIAREKCGIIKPRKPVATVEQPAMSVIEEECASKSADILVVGRDIAWKAVPLGLGGQLVEVSNGLRMKSEISLLGACQAENAAIACAAVELLTKRGWNVPDVAIKEGLERTRWPARFEVVRREPLVVVDGTHNPLGAEALRETILSHCSNRDLHLVIGVLNDKDIDSMAGTLAPLCRNVYATRPKSERAYEPERVAGAFSRLVKDIAICPTIDKAIARALSEADDGDMVLVTGSLYTAGEALRYLDAQPK